jgi:hypothetical protein
MMEHEIHHRDTEHTELTQRLASSLCVLRVLCVSVVNAAFLFTQFKLTHYQMSESFGQFSLD